MIRQNSFLALVQEQKQLRKEKFLEEMEQVIPWEEFCKVIEPYYEEKKTGRKKMEMTMMLKIYFLQQWYNLSDPAVEEEVYDRGSFQKFLGIDLLSQKVPDETTILNFRHLLEKHQLPQQFLAVVNKILEGRGLLMKGGSIVDATIIAAPSSSKNKKQKRDPEMSSTKKGNQWYFGMKAHIGVDAQSGLVHHLETTAAKTNDRVPFQQLLHGEEKILFGDKSYGKQEDKRHARATGILWAISDRGTPRHRLSFSQRKRNKKFSRVRAKIEHSFQVIKCQWQFTKVRYRGLFKNTMQLFTLFSLVNLFRVRKMLLCSA